MVQQHVQGPRIYLNEVKRRGHNKLNFKRVMVQLVIDLVRLSHFLGIMRLSGLIMTLRVQGPRIYLRRIRVPRRGRNNRNLLRVMQPQVITLVGKLRFLVTLL